MTKKTEQIALKTEQDKLVPGGELESILREAIQTVEDELALEDAGWISLSAQTGDVITAADRINNLKLSRLYNAKDPLGKQSIRLWTDYTFGTGMTWSVDEENKKTKEVLDKFWDSTANKGVLSARGQRKSSDKLLEDGEVFFAIFLGTNGESKIRRIDPLEITEIITNPDDIEDVRYYKREWADPQGKNHSAFYRSYTNIKNEGTKDSQGVEVTQSDDADALIYHLTYNTTTQRGNPLLLPALDWIKQYRRFLASRVAIMLALARFAWRSKVKGGQAAVDTIKAKTHEQEIPAGSTQVENLGVDTTPIKADSGSPQAYQDARMLRLQVCAAVGIPEQYYGDISTGNLATAKTVELPMLKMFTSYQAIWAGAYNDMDNLVLEHENIPEDKRYVDRDFPPIAPEDVQAAAKSIVDICGVFPAFTDSPDIQQIALLTLGVNDPAEVLEQLGKLEKSIPEVAMRKAVRSLIREIKDIQKLNKEQ